MNLSLLPTILAATAPCPSATGSTGNTSGLISAAGLHHTCAGSTTLNTVFLVVFTIIGGMAFLFLVIAGLRYIFARGEAEAIKKAKNQIQYSLIGLVIAASAAALVNFVIDRLK